jgi:nitrogen-specific signal transduction histidine kinase/CheY-like chemotaxis protein
VVIARDVTERNDMFARMALADRMLSVGTLAAGVAHEINNPLAYVATNLETISHELPFIQVKRGSRLTDSALQAFVADACEGVTRMSAIVKDLRSLARPDEEVRGPVDIVAVLASSIKMTHNELRHRARVVTSFGGELPAVEADPSRLGQVFLNLLLNAAQAIPEGHADRNEIRIVTSTIGDSVRIDITDTGAGIAPKVLRRIFDPFFTTKPHGHGMGLGLSISHQIVRSLGGDITVASSPGRGSTFTVTLPIATPVSVVEVAAGGTREHAGGRILLIDDEPALGRSLTVLLAPETEVIAVTRADDALARLQRGEQFDAILCDLMMPEVSGMELFDELAREVPAYSERVIFMTGGAFTPQARAFLTRLDRPHLEKPFSEAQLRDAIHRVSVRVTDRT